MAGSKRKHKSNNLPPPKHHISLDSDDEVSVSISKKQRFRNQNDHQSDQKLLGSSLSSKILKEALAQQKEIEGEEETAFAAVDAVHPMYEDDFDAGFSESQCFYGKEEVEEIDEEDEKVLSLFFSEDGEPNPTMANLIVEKLKEKSAADPDKEEQSLTSIIELYKGVGKHMSSYTHGKMNSAFKYIPSLSVWQDVLQLTEPEKWSPHAIYQATRILSSNLHYNEAQKFYSLILLPRVRNDIRKNKRLHFSLYQSLKASLYKPAAFYKGILFPLCESGTCSPREKNIIGSIIQKASIPTKQSSAAIITLAEMDFSGTTSYFMKILLDKKYALYHKALDAVVAHFMRFLECGKVMPVIWHQSLLAFAQRYKDELTKTDKDNLYRLLHRQNHHLITPDIRRELDNSRDREEMAGDKMSISQTTCITSRPIVEDRWDYPEVPIEED